MTKPLTYKDIKSMYVKKFGREPVITGVNFWKSDELIDNMLNAIDTGVEYIEQEIDKDTLV